MGGEPYRPKIRRCKWFLGKDRVLPILLHSVTNTQLLPERETLSFRLPAQNGFL